MGFLLNHVFALITCFARDFQKIIKNQAKKIGSEDLDQFSLEDKTLGIIGFGGIGRGIARIGNAFDMKIIAVDPKQTNVPSYVKKNLSSRIY